MIAMPQATTAPYIQRFTKCEFDRYLLIFCKNEQKLVFDSFELKISKYRHSSFNLVFWAWEKPC